jgi:glutaconate CoA-transferase, subunit B
LQKGKFVNRVQYVTSPGFLSGPGEREKAGLYGHGPVMVVTDRCIFGFDEKTKEMHLTKLYPGVKPEDIKPLVGWDLRVSSDLQEVDPPTGEELRVMRAFDSMGFILKRRSSDQPEAFDDFCRNMKSAYESIRLDSCQEES